ncbi:MAG: translation initiation factor IF-2 [Bacteroidetes bacterium RIFCSPLOWO2_12_FULL_35_15]|nr:MAG: translation initiation factor IF-2 [Bacteroidetes bacterium RIFCSPLOWO2_12_FULL_35_15]
MSENTVQRLSKVAKELNVSVSTITEFLKGKGHVIENNPMAKISEELYSILSKEYQSEKAAKEEAKQVTSSSRAKKESITLDEEAKVSNVKKVEEEEDIIIKNVQNIPPPEKIKEKPVEIVSKKTEPEEEKEVIKSDVKFTVVSKIDLDALNTKTKPAKKTKLTKEEEKAAKEEEKKAKAKPTKGKAKAKKEDEVVEEQKEVQEIKAPVVEAEVIPEIKSSDLPQEDFLATKVEKLEGPKIMGKIDLPVKEERKKPVASSTPATPANDNKKKRKRIKKSYGGATLGDTWNANKKPGTPGATGTTGGTGTPVNNAPRKQYPNNTFTPQTPRGKYVKPGKVVLTPEEIQAQIKETLARLSGAGKSKASKHRKSKRDMVSERIQEAADQQEAEKKVIKVTEFVSANQLAQMMDISVNEIISTCMSLGMFVSINQRLDAETIAIVAEEFGYSLEFVSVEVQEAIKEEEDTEDQLLSRSPIVTVMGHVDHGKTSLLDYIRKANVIAGEAGGITQHIGAYNVKLENEKTITFLDTPGHEAFTAMRARGAQVTDIAIIVVAADDSVMPQTIEAINHAQAAGVPIVIAINKIDKPGANPDKIREALSQLNILVEEWGGKVQCQEISAKKGSNIETLLEKVLLEAEMLNLKANPNKNATGTVIESELDKGRGYVSTILVEAGTLKVGDIVLAGCFSGKVKALHNERGQVVKEAGPAMPVILLGLSGAPQAGDKFHVMSDEREAREIAAKRLQLQREQGIRTNKHITLDEIGRRLAIGDFKELNVIVKGDVDGSVEALADSLQKLSTEKIQIKIIHKSVGAISESDVLLASASNAIVVGFQVRPSAGARKIAETEQIDIRLYSIIYDAINEIKAAMEGMLAPEFEEKIVCNIEIREVFNITRVGTIAGCFVLDGKVTRNTKVRVISDGIVVHTGELGSLKRFKDDVKEVNKGFECGLNIKNFNGIKVGDIIEGYELVEVKAKL